MKDLTNLPTTTLTRTACIAAVLKAIDGKAHDKTANAACLAYIEQTGDSQTARRQCEELIDIIKADLLSSLSPTAPKEAQKATYNKVVSATRFFARAVKAKYAVNVVFRTHKTAPTVSEVKEDKTPATREERVAATLLKAYPHLSTQSAAVIIDGLVAAEKSAMADIATAAREERARALAPQLAEFTILVADVAKAKKIKPALAAEILAMTGNVEDVVYDGWLAQQA